MKLGILISALLSSSFVAANPIFRRAKSETSASVSVSATSSASLNYTQTATIHDPASTTDGVWSVTQGRFGAVFKPKVMIINMFTKEETLWIKNLDLMFNISVPMLSPEYPYVHSNGNFSVMSVTTGEGEINAATTISALAMSPLFDFTETYFLISGIAGGSPDMVTIGSVTYAKYAVQVGLAYEVDSREIPSDWKYGFVNFNTDENNEYPLTIYGSEIFELNESLMRRAMHVASNVTLNNGTAGNVAIREKYNSTAPAFDSPKLVACDTATSDVYWTGNLMAQAMGDFVSTISNGTAKYCSTQQEDNATLEAMLRAAKHGILDFNRIVVTRSISDFDSPPPSLNATSFFFDTYQGGSSAAVQNLYIAGLPFVKDILHNWETLYRENQFMPKNYIGDYFETLGGVRNFGLSTE
ncbi:LAFE_0H04478g1_1 [Lachancea fermentati]|uniref:LAFE_0H04478g1_1 n=1 Tax=Lachancea fermentati TaxID=4955 RepID=A0A1G4MJQ2_LACFM|nr:LAFE_0H04478g1_1 [Lachancea fermentati]